MAELRLGYGAHAGRGCSAQMVLPVDVWRLPQRSATWATSSRPLPPSSNTRARRRGKVCHRRRGDGPARPFVTICHRGSPEPHHDTVSVLVPQREITCPWAPGGHIAAHGCGKSRGKQVLESPAHDILGPVPQQALGAGTPHRDRRIGVEGDGEVLRCFCDSRSGGSGGFVVHRCHPRSCCNRVRRRAPQRRLCLQHPAATQRVQPAGLRVVVPDLG